MTNENKVEIAKQEYQLGLQCYKGTADIQPDFSKAFLHFSKAIELSDHSEALYLAGLMLINGTSVDKDTAHGLKYLNRTAQKHMNKRAHDALSQIYSKGIGVKQNKEIADAHKYASMRDVSVEDGAAELVKAYYLAKKYNEAQAYSKYALNDKDVLAILGWMAFNGDIYGEPDYEEAYDWFEKSDKKGYEEGAYMMAKSMIKGSLKFTLYGAPILLKRAMDNGHPKAAQDLSRFTIVLYKLGAGKEAYEYAKMTEEFPWSKGIICLATLSGSGCKKDIKGALEYAKANSDNVICMSAIGLDLLFGVTQKKNVKKGINVLRESSQYWTLSAVLLGAYFKKRLPVLAYYYFNSVREAESIAEKEAAQMEQTLTKEAKDYFKHYAEEKIKSVVDDLTIEFTIGLNRLIHSDFSDADADTLREYMGIAFDIENIDFDDPLIWSALDEGLDRAADGVADAFSDLF